MHPVRTLMGDLTRLLVLRCVIACYAAPFLDNVYSLNISEHHRVPDISYLGSTAIPPRTLIPTHIRSAIDKSLNCSQHGWELRQGGRTRLFDCSLFRDELDILEVRLNELYDWVDVFLIIELGTGHQGYLRNSTFLNCLAEPECAVRFTPLLDKIRYVFVGALDVCLAGRVWDCEKQHRGLLGWAFDEFGGRDDDMAIIGDGDEFPHATAAWMLANCAVPEGVTIESALYMFSAHCRDPKPYMHLKAGWLPKVLCVFRAYHRVGNRSRGSMPAIRSILPQFLLTVLVFAALKIDNVVASIKPRPRCGVRVMGTSISGLVGISACLNV